jgi:predicted ATPase
MDKPVFLRRVTLRNYKSIATCDVRLGRLEFLVGPNASGKSNFIDALRLVSESLRQSLDLALRDRGGIREVRRRSTGHPNHFRIELDLELPGGISGHYAFEVGSRRDEGYVVKQEKCEVTRLRMEPGSEFPSATFCVEAGEVTSSSLERPPPAAPDRLYLVNVSGFPEFRPVYDALSHMGFYNLNPAAIRELQPPDLGDVLKRDGSNIASVVAKLEKRSPEVKTRIEEYLGKVVPGVHGVTVKSVGPKETIEFRQAVSGSKEPWRFFSANMSDGTLRALGVLVALFQAWNHAEASIPLVGIEEPELALNPGAAGVLLDSLRAASRGRQILATSHGPDLLDDESVGDDCILAVSNEDGATRIARPDGVARSALRDRLYTAGELLRLGQLVPDQATDDERRPEDLSGSEIEESA